MLPGRVQKISDGMTYPVRPKAEYFVTTDDKLIKKLIGVNEISVVNPIGMAGIIDEYHN